MAKKPTPISTRYDYETIASPAVDFNEKDPNSRSLTNQSDKEGTDINLIMARYEKTGQITVNGETRQPLYGDFTITGDYHTLQANLANINQAFAALPAKTRAQFNNDPGLLIAFLSDPKNDAQAIALGLKSQPDAKIVPDVPAQKTPAPVVPAPGQAANPPA